MILKNSFVAKFKETSGVTQDIYNDAFNDGKQEGIEQGLEQGLENAKNYLEEKRITKNGVYTATEPNFGFSKVEVRVDVPPDYVNPEGTTQITENGTYNVEHFEFAEVNVPIPDGYIKPSGTIDITEEGEFNVAQYETANVKMGGGGSANPMQAYFNGWSSNNAAVFEYWKGTDATPVLQGVDTSMVTNANKMFYSCTNLETVPQFDVSNANTIANMFGNCSKLQSISIANASKVITAEYFASGCTSVKKIAVRNLSSTLKMTYQMFYNCTSLQTVDFRGASGVPTLVDTATFYKVPSTCKVVIPDELYDSWTNATNWSALTITYVKASEYVEE